jgi:uncharacterized repeat protein (TIGR04076 family)
MSNKVKITVLETSVNQELVDRFATRPKTISPCTALKAGQEFTTDEVGMPAGFCPWAWNDIYKVVVAYFANGSFGMWGEDGDSMIACCTDGERPVYFKLEKLTAE